MLMSRQFKFLVMLLLVSFITVACTPAGTDKEETVVVPSVNVVISDGSSEETADEPIDYVIAASDFEYAPNLIEAEVGKTVRIKITSDGQHDFVIDELGIDTGLIRGETIVELTIPTEAVDESYEFYCSVGNHRQMGMVGTLIVHSPQQQ